MDQVIEAFISGNAWGWLVLGLVLIIAEVLAPTFWLLWPGLAALGLGLVTVITGPFDWRIQGVIFTMLAMAATIAGRRYMASRAPRAPEAPTLNRRNEQYQGRLVRVSEGFAGGRGRIAIDDTVWLAEVTDGTSPAAGETVEVVGVDGTVLKVKAVPAPSPRETKSVA